MIGVGRPVKEVQSAQTFSNEVNVLNCSNEAICSFVGYIPAVPTGNARIMPAGCVSCGLESPTGDMNRSLKICEPVSSLCRAK